MITIPSPSFEPEKLVLAVDGEGSDHERQEAHLYMKSILTGRRVKLQVVQNACKIYAEWWLNSRVYESQTKDLKHFNASGSYLVTADLDEGVNYSSKIKHNDEDKIKKFIVYPDLYVYDVNYRGGIGYVITHVQNGEPINIIPKDQSNEKRSDTISSMINSGATDMGRAGFNDAYTGHKLGLQNATTYISELGALPITDLREGGALS